MRFVNLTPHAIDYYREDGTIVKIPSQGVARAEQITEPIAEVDGFKISRCVFGKPVNLPDYSDGTMLIVSLQTIQAAIRHGRRADDLVTTCDLVRDSDGRILGCRSFARVD